MLVAQSCLNLWDHMDCSLPSSFFHGILQARILGWVCHSFLQGILLTQGSNPDLPHYRMIFLLAEPPGEPHCIIIVNTIYSYLVIWMLEDIHSWWWTGRPGMLRFMGSQSIGHDWATELNWTEEKESSINNGYITLQLDSKVTVFWKISILIIR